MTNNKLKTITSLFEGYEIRSVWDKDLEDYFFSVIDVIFALTDTPRPRKYWNDLKKKLSNEGSQLSDKIGQFKMLAKDGKMRETDVLDTKGILRLIESVPSPKAEPFKLWLASLGKERIDEIFDPEKAINRAINYYHKKGYDDAWIRMRLISIIDRKQLTKVWKDNGVKNPSDYANLTNEIYKAWSGMKANEYKEYKGIKKQSLRDNMTPIELSLANLGEVATRELTKENKPKNLEENKKIARKGGNVSKVARDNLEKELGRSVISKENNLGYRYIDENKQIKEKEDVDGV